MFESGCFPRESGRFFYVVYEHEKTSKRLVLNVLAF